MAIGVMISGIVSGLFAVIWTLIVGAPVLVVLFAYPVGGMGSMTATGEDKSEIRPFQNETNHYINETCTNRT